MPAIAHRNCRLPGKTTQAMATQATQGHQLEGPTTTTPGTLGAHQGRNRNEPRKENNNIPNLQTQQR